MEESVPAAEATVWTMLFSWTVAFLKPRKIAIEMTAAGMEVRESETGFEAEVGISGGENQRDDDTDDQSADGQFLSHKSGENSAAAA